jgi:hypothetical protein
MVRTVLFDRVERMQAGPRFFLTTKGSHHGGKHGDQIAENAQEARQAEPGPTVRNLLVASTCLVIVALAIIWFVFFRT